MKSSGRVSGCAIRCQKMFPRQMWGVIFTPLECKLKKERKKINPSPIMARENHEICRLKKKKNKKRIVRKKSFSLLNSKYLFVIANMDLWTPLRWSNTPHGYRGRVFPLMRFTSKLSNYFTLTLVSKVDLQDLKLSYIIPRLVNRVYYFYEPLANMLKFFYKCFVILLPSTFLFSLNFRLATCFRLNQLLSFNERAHLF